MYIKVEWFTNPRNTVEGSRDYPRQQKNFTKEFISLREELWLRFKYILILA